jgi:hypothetical protein
MIAATPLTAAATVQNNWQPLPVTDGKKICDLL